MTENPTRYRRERWVRWDDSFAGARGGLAMAGRDSLEAMRHGDLRAPPICHLLGFWITEREEGRVVMRALPAEYHYNPIGAVHGGGRRDPARFGHWVPRSIRRCPPDAATR